MERPRILPVVRELVPVREQRNELPEPARRFFRYQRVCSCIAKAGCVSKAEQYRARAVDCEHMAKEARDPVLKWELADLARQWRELAEDVERYGL